LIQQNGAPAGHFHELRDAAQRTACGASIFAKMKRERIVFAVFEACCAKSYADGLAKVSENRTPSGQLMT